MEQVIIIGAGPCGMSVATKLKDQGIDPLIIEKGCIVNSIYGYPTYMNFFSTAELLEIGDIPFVVSGDKPTRPEALQYYREVAKRRDLRIHTYEKVLNITKASDGKFVVQTEERHGKLNTYEADYVVLATGYFDNPKLLGIKGEDLPKVSHYFKEAHPYQGQRVAVIGGKNSAVEACMELVKVGADVTWIYRGATFSESIKPWVRPVFESIVNKEKIKVMWSSKVTRIKEQEIEVEGPDGMQTLANDYVFALTGYHPNHAMLREIDVHINEETGEPVYNPETMETNVEGLYIAGVLAAGNNANVIFIENGRLHADPIAASIKSKN